MKRLVMQFYPFKLFPQGYVFKYPQFMFLPQCQSPKFHTHTELR
jgi:hypothetical protein